MAQFPLDKNPTLIFCEALIINRRKKVLLNLALDTGATYTMISTDALLEIGLDPTKAKKNVEVTTGSGVIVTPIITVPLFCSIGQEVKKLEIVCHTLPSEGVVDGLLGLNFLKNFDVYLMFRKGKMEIQ